MILEHYMSTSENHFQTDDKIASVSIAVLGSEFPTHTANKRIHITLKIIP